MSQHRAGVRSRWLRQTTVVTTVALVAGLCAWARPQAAVAAPPATADNDVKDIWNGLDALQTFSQGLASDGAFGQALSDVGLTPGSPDGVGFADLFQKLFIDRLSAANPLHLADLVNTLTTSSSLNLGGRNASVAVTSSTSGSVESLAVDVTVTRHVASAPLSLSVTSPQFDFSAPVQVDLAFHNTFTINYDTAARSVYIDTASNPPTMTLKADAHFPCATGTPPCTQDTSGVHAGVGILGIDLASGSSFDLTTNLKATLRDPNGDGRVGLGTFASGSFQPFAEPNGSGGTNPGELAGGAAAAAGMLSVGFDSPPGSLHATLNLVASTQLGSFSLPSVNATVQVDWADISTGSPTVTVPTGSLSVVQSFQNLSPRDLAQGLAQLATALEAVQSSRTYTPVTGGKTGTTSALASGGDTVSYTVTSGGAPAVDDFFQIGSGTGAPVVNVAKVSGSGPYTLIFNSPVNAAVSSGTTLTQVNAGGNVDLPFMKGSLADVFAANEAIVAFVNKHVKQLYNAIPTGGRSGTLSGVSGQTGSYASVAGGAPVVGDFYQVGTVTKRVTAVSGSGPYSLTFDTAFSPAPADGTAAVQVQLGDIAPDFASVQAMLSELAAETGLPGGSHFITDTVSYDATTSKLSLGLGVSRSQTAGIDLDPFVAAVTGTANYAVDPTGNPTLTDNSQTWTTNAFAGRLVKAGSSTNVVKGNDAHTLTFTGAWHGSTPTNGTSYQIGGPDSQLGSVSLANKLDQLASGSGIVNANAQVPVATVQPSYSAHLTLVLDLEAPGCVGKMFNGTTNTQACPFTATNADGSSTVVNSLPTPADRVMLRTADSNGPLHLLTADAPIHSQVDINATVGFLGLHMSGTLDECAAFSSGTTCPDPASASTHLLSVDFASGLGDAQHDIAIGDLFHRLASSPKSVINVSVNGQAKASITPDIPGVSDFFGVTPPTFTLSMSDITDPSTISFDTGSFSTALDKIKAFNFDTSNPKALFDEILQTLKTFSKLLKTVGNSTNPAIQQVLGTKIPVVGLKLGDVFAASEQGQGDNVSYGDTTLTDTDGHFSNDLLLRTVVAGTSVGVVVATTPTQLTVASWQGGKPTDGTQYRVENALDSAIDLLTANPADNLQQLVGLVNERLGAASVPITFTVDTSGATPVLGLAVDWKRDFHFTTPMAFDFQLGSSADAIVGTQAKGLVKLHATAEAKAKLLLPLSVGSETGPSDPTGLQVDPANTGLSASVGADVTGYIKANFGPLNLSLGEPVDSNPTHPAEAHATFGVGLGSSDTAPESISDFLKNIASSGVQFNQGAQAVNCAGDSTPNLGLCAALPLYLSTDGGQTYNPVNTGTATDPPDTMRLRLPLSGDLSQEFALTDSGGTLLHVVPTDTTTPLRLDIPGSMLTDLANAVLDFSQLGQGLDGYFKFAEQALNLASFGGKLPLIGKDLQEGAQFLEKVQASVDSKLGDLASVSDEAGLKNWINNQLHDALSSVLPPGSALTVDVVCSVRLATPGNVAGSATATTPSPTTDYKYRVSATDPKGETVASDPITVTSVALTTTETVTVTWDKVSGADGYKVYRSADGGTTWSQFSVGQSNNPSFTDTGAAGTTASPKDGNPATDNPPLEPCPVTDITGITLTTDIGQGKVTKDTGCEDDGTSTCITGLSTPLDIGIPGLSISAATNNGTPDPAQNVSVKLGWRIHLKIGLDKNRGFFIETQDQANPEIALGAALSLPKSIQANIAFLKINLCNFDVSETTGSAPCPFTPLVPNDVTRTAGSPRPLFAGMFGLDLHTPTDPNAFDTTITPNDDPSHDITLKDLTNFAQLKQLVTVGLSAAVHIDWDFQVTADAALPGIGGEFKLDWTWGATLGKPAVAKDSGDDATPPTDGDGAPTIAFDNVYITAGGFLSGVLKPVLKEVQSFTSPLKPVIDTLYAPIPVLSDLSHLAGGGDVTLITMAEAFSTIAGGPDLTMVERVLEIIKLVNSIPSGDGGLGIFIGTFNVSGAKAIGTPATPTNSATLISSHTDAPNSENGGNSVAGAVDSGSGGAGGKVSESSSKGGFSFPVLQTPSSIFNLLMGGDVDLIRFDSGNLTLGFTYSQQFGPVYAPPPVLITISGSASVTARIIAGFDTYGLRKGFEAINSGARSVALGILDSLFLYTVDPTKNDGKPVPVLTLHGELAAGAEVSVLIVSVGVEGGISLTINFYWNDPDNDGKFRTSEFLATAFSNPLCLFNTDGDLSVFLRVFVTIGIGPFSTTFSFTLVSIKLLDFSIHPNCSPPPPELAEVQDHVLYLFFGKLGHDSERGSPWGNDNGSNTGADETVKVHELHDTTGTFTGFAVDALSRHEEFLDSSITTVVLDARGYPGKENVVIGGDSDQSKPPSDGPPTPRPFDKTAIIFGGTNDDTIKIDGGTAHVDGGGGNDTINLTGNGNDFVAGGPGNDTITTGNGNDTIAGDSSLPITSSVTLGNHRQVGDPAPQGSWVDQPGVPNGVGAPTAAEASTDGADSILVGYGQDTVYGNGGDDSIAVATDKPLTASETRQPGVNAASDGSLFVGGTGNNHIHGGSGSDTIYAGQQWPGSVTDADKPNYAGVAGDGTNVVDSGGGNDTVYGGSNTDVITGHSVSGGKDIIYGGAGDDVLLGGDGADQIYGGPGNDYISGGPAKVDPISPPDAVLGAWKITPTPDGQPVDGKLLVGGDNTDHIYGANGGDQIYADRQEDTCVAPPALTTLTSAASIGDTVVSVASTAGLRPGAAFMIDPTSTVAEAYPIASVGASSVTLASALTHAHASGAPAGEPRSTPPPEVYTASPAGDNYIVGGNGNNVITGGGGNDTIFAGTANDLICGGAGADKIYGGAGHDNVFGGSGDDLIVGGSGNSALYGNDGNDTILGGSGNNWIEGNAGNDTIDGGTANAVIIGGTSAPMQSDTGDTINGGSGSAVVVIGDNGTVDPNASWPASGAPYATTPNRIHTYDLDANAPANTTYGGNDTIWGGPGNDEIYGGLGNDHIVGGTGVDHIEGGPGCDTIYGGTRDDDIIGGTSPQAVGGDAAFVDNVPDGCNGSAVAVTPATIGTFTPVVGDTIFGFLPYGPNPIHHNVIVGGNGSITRTGATDQNDGAAVRKVQLLALLRVGGNDTITGGPGDDLIFGGLGDDLIHTGNGNNYVEGGPGNNAIFGGHGSNDIIGGTSPLALPTSGPDALSTSAVPSGNDTIYADGLTAPPAGGAPEDGGNVVLGDNGCVSRGTSGAPTDANGCPTGPSANPPRWTYSTADITVAAPGVLVRPVIRQLDVFDCPNASCTPDVQGAADVIYGGTGNDLLFGEVGNDQVYGGPPGTNGIGGTAGIFAGNDYMEGGAGADTMAGGGGDDDMIGGSAPTYLPPGKTTAMISDGVAGGSGFSLPAPANSLLSIGGSGVIGNTMDGGTGNDVMIGGNGSITHNIGPSGKWVLNANDGATVRSAVQLDLANGGSTAIGGDDVMRGGPGDDKMFGGTGNDFMDGGPGDDYLEGGPGRNILQGGAGDDDLIGGTSPIALPATPGQTTETAAGAMPNGTPDPAHPGQRLGNIICGFYCGQSLAVGAGSDDDVVVGNNGRIDRCPAKVSGGVGTPQGSDGCSWTRSNYGSEKTSSFANGTTGGAQTAVLCTAVGPGCPVVNLGNPRTRFTTLLGQDPTETTHNGNDYIEGNGGNDVMYGEDGNDSVHGDTPAPNSPRLDECLPTNDPAAGQDIIVGGYGNDTLCGDGGDDGILGNRGLVGVLNTSGPWAGTSGAVTPVPFSVTKTVIGTTSGGPYGTLTEPTSGNTIYPVRLDVEYVDGVLTPVPNWNNSTATGQANQHDIIFGGQGNDSIHGSPGDDFLQGDDGPHIAGQPASRGGDDILFGGGGSDSIQGGPGNDHIFGGQGNDDQDVVRSDTAIAPKVDETGACLPPAFPTLNVAPSSVGAANGFCARPNFWANTSYASRFPTVGAITYDSDPGAQDNGGQTSKTNVFGDLLYGGYNRDISQSQGTPAGYGDRIIDSLGAYNMEFVCPAAYGGSQIIRSLSPGMLTFLQQLGAGDGAYNVNSSSKPPATNSSGDTEVSIVYPGTNQPDNGGSAYPNTAGHFTC